LAQDSIDDGLIATDTTVPVEIGQRADLVATCQPVTPAPSASMMPAASIPTRVGKDRKLNE